MLYMPMRNAKMFDNNHRVGRAVANVFKAHRDIL